jgi:hypothetical protein
MNTRTLKLAIPVVALTIVAATAPAYADIQNGSFEKGSSPPSYYTSLYTGDTSISGWTVGGRVDWSNGCPPSGVTGWAEDGCLGAQLVVDLHGASSISQTFDTVGGTLYNVSFWATETPGTTTSPLFVDFTNNGINKTSSVSFPVGGITAYSWHRYDFQFSTAAGTTFSTLDFRNDQTHLGPFIDNVTASASVPEPAFLSLFAINIVGICAAFLRNSFHRS